MRMENLHNEQKVLANLIDSNDDLWRPISLAALLSATAVPMALFVTMALWWFELVRYFWWWLVALSFGSLAAVWGVYWLLSYSIGLNMLLVKLQGARAAAAYNRSLERLANADMNRPVFIEPEQPADRVEIIEEEPPFLINRGDDTAYLSREAAQKPSLLGAANQPRLATSSIMEHSLPAAPSRRQQIEAQYGLNPSSIKTTAKAVVKPQAPRRVMLKVADDVSIDKRDILFFLEQAFTVGAKAGEWRKRFNQARYTHELTGAELQKQIFTYLANRNLLCKGANNGWLLNPDYHSASQVIDHLKL